MENDPNTHSSTEMTGFIFKIRALCENRISIIFLFHWKEDLLGMMQIRLLCIDKGNEKVAKKRDCVCVCGRIGLIK